MYLDFNFFNKIIYFIRLSVQNSRTRLLMKGFFKNSDSDGCLVAVSKPDSVLQYF